MNNGSMTVPSSLTTAAATRNPLPLRYAPPGGQTSISLGDYATETPAAANGAASKAKAQMASPPRAPTPTRAKAATPTASPPAELAVSAAGLHVGVAVCESEALKSSTVAALQQLGESQREL